MNKSPIFIISGGQGAGKTTTLRRVIEELKKNSISTVGFVAEGEWEKGQRTQFYIADVNSPDKILLCQSNESKVFEKQGRFYFNPKAIQFGEKLLKTKEAKSAVVIDEIGLFEIDGHVWAPIFKELILNADAPVIITVRDTFVDQVISTFNITISEVFHCKTSPELIAKKIQEAIG